MFRGRDAKTYEIIAKSEQSDRIEGVNFTQGNDAGFDAEEKAFWITSDRIRFKQLFDITSEIVAAHGFTINIENVLAALDTLTFAVRAGTDGTPSGKVLTASDCIKFRLPEKRRTGPFLKLLYEEISAYEGEIRRLAAMGSGSSKVSDKDAEIRRLSEQVRQLTDERDRLEGTVDQLSRSLRELERREASSNRAIEEQNLLPAGIRSGKVRDISVEENRVQIKTGRTTVTVALGTMNAVPKIGSDCLVIQDVAKSRPAVGYIFGDDSTAFDEECGEILDRSETSLKFRDGSRRVWTKSLQTSSDKSSPELIRGCVVTIKKAQGVPVSVKPLKNDSSMERMIILQSRICEQQLMGTSPESSDQENQESSDEAV